MHVYKTRYILPTNKELQNASCSSFLIYPQSMCKHQFVVTGCGSMCSFRPTRESLPVLRRVITSELQFMPMLGAARRSGHLNRGRSLTCYICCDIGFCGLVWKIAPYGHLYDKQTVIKTYSNPDPNRVLKAMFATLVGFIAIMYRDTGSNF
jgi:hypothetical protein